MGENKELHDANLEIMNYTPVRLNKTQRGIVSESVTRTAKGLKQELFTVAIASNHVHIVVENIGRDIGEVVSIYKNKARIALRKRGFEERLWTRGYDKRYCFDEGALKTRIKYVEGHRKKKPPT